MKDLVLIHHGIEGQHWGKKNGPPYPLDYSSHSAEQKKKNPKASLSKYSKEGEKLNKHDLRAMRKYSSKVVYFNKQEPGERQKELLEKYKKEAESTEAEKRLTEMDKQREEYRKKVEELRKKGYYTDEKATIKLAQELYDFEEQYNKLLVQNSKEGAEIAKKYVKEMNYALTSDMGMANAKKGAEHLTRNNLAWNARNIYNYTFFYGNK